MRLKFLMILVLSVFCCCGCGSSSNGNRPNPQAPSNLTVSSADLNSITLSWNNVSGATSYNIYYNITESPTKANGTKIENVTSPYTQTDISQGIKYRYIVTAVDSTGESLPSNEASSYAKFNGVIDTTFGTNGFVDIVEGSPFADKSDAVIGVDGNGNSYLAMQNGDGSNEYSLWKITSAGVLDSSFGTGGKTTVTVTGCEECTNTTILPDPSGNIYLLSYSDTNADSFIIKIKSNGSIDTTFGTSGIASYDSVKFNSGMILNSGIVAVGSDSSVVPDKCLALYISLSDGSVDEDVSYSPDESCQFDKVATSNFLSDIYLVLDVDYTTYYLSKLGNGDPFDPVFGNNGTLGILGDENDLGAFVHDNEYLYLIGDVKQSDDISFVFVVKASMLNGNSGTGFGWDGIYLDATGYGYGMSGIVTGDTLVVAKASFNSDDNLISQLTALDTNDASLKSDVFTDGIYSDSVYQPLLLQFTSQGMVSLGVSYNSPTDVRLTIARFK